MMHMPFSDECDMQMNEIFIKFEVLALHNKYLVKLMTNRELWFTASEKQ